MSYLAEELKRLIKKRRVQRNLVAQRAGLIPSHLSHILNDKQKHVYPEDMAKIANAITEIPSEKTGIVYAYFRDQKKIMDHVRGFVGVGPAALSLSSGVPCSRVEMPDVQIKLPDELKETLCRLALLAAGDANLSQTLLALSRLADPGDKS